MTASRLRLKSIFAAAFDPTHGAAQLLRLVLAGLALAISVRSTLVSYAIPIWGVDVVVPLRAAERWLSGGQPYLASAFQAGSGYDVPYLYPPILLPAFAPLTVIPIQAVIVGANVTCALLAYAACRRLGLPPAVAALALVWPPFSGAIAGGNLQVLLFAAFVAVYWLDARREPGPGPRAFGETQRVPAMRDGLVAVAIPVVKASQAHAWVALLRLRPQAAILGLVAVVVVALALLPLTGIQGWLDWLDQTRRAADPAWPLRGQGLTRDAPPLVTTAFAAATMLAALVVPARRAGPWIGLLTLVGAPALRVYSVVFALPAMLELRREMALVAAILVATYTLEGLWLGVALVAGAYVLARRFPALLEPRPPTTPPPSPVRS